MRVTLIPLSKLFRFVNKELSSNVGETLAVLLNITFNNLVELIIIIIALVNGQIRNVKATILGSIFFCIHLLGLCFLIGEISSFDRHKLLEHNFNSSIARMSSSLMLLACIALILPATASIFINKSFTLSNNQVDDRIMNISYGTSILKTYKALLVKKENEESSEQKCENKKQEIEEQTNEREENEMHINGVVISLSISQTFIGIILLPIFSNIAKSIASITSAAEDKMNAVIITSLESSI
ncbi:4408_t:CDS:2, partial [Dentiscutata heterogama]